MIRNRRTGEVLATRPVFADTFLLRLRGLLGRAGLEEGEALVLSPCTSVHMFFMRFALDVVFTRADGEVVAVYEDLRPWKISGIHPEATHAVELPVGVIAASGTEVGDTLEIGRGARGGDATRREDAGEEGEGDPLLRVAVAVVVLAGALLQVAPQPTYLLLLAVLAGAGAARGLASSRLAPPPPPLAAAVLWLLFHLAHALVVSPTPYVSRSAWARRTAHVSALVLGVAAGATGTGGALAGPALAAGAVHGAIALQDARDGAKGKAHWADPGGAGATRVGGLFGNPNLLGLFLAMVLPFGVAGVVRGRGLARLANGVGLAFVVTGLGLSYSRSSWLVALAGAVAVLLALRREERRLGLGVLAGCLLLGAWMAPGAAARAGSVARAGEFGMAQRAALYRGVLRMARARPLLGHGAGSFHGAFPRYRELGGQYPFDAHGQFLQEAVETGALGLGVFLILGVAATLAMRRARSGGLADPGAQAATVAGAAGMLFASPFAYTPLALQFMVTLGVACAVPASGKRDLAGRDPEAGSGTRWVLGGAALAGALLLACNRAAEPLRAVVRGGVKGIEGMDPGPRLRTDIAGQLAPALRERLRDAERLEPGVPEHAFLEGRLLLALGLPGRADEAFRECLRRDPFESLAWAQRARAHEQQGDLASAEEALDRALELDPRSEDLMRRKADLYRQRGALEAAGKLLEAALRTNPAFLRVNTTTYPKVFRSLIALRLAQGRVEEAEDLRARYLDLYGGLLEGP